MRCLGRVSSCDACYTDYDLTIDDRDGWLVTLRTYHRVGAGREPTELPWASGGPERLYSLYGGRDHMERVAEDDGEGDANTEEPRGSSRRCEKKVVGGCGCQRLKGRIHLLFIYMPYIETGKEGAAFSKASYYQ